jgi:peptide/nickel transport system permease protein
MTTAAAVAAPRAAVGRSLGWARSNVGMTLCLCVIAAAVIAAVAAPVLAPYSPTAVDLEHSLAGPSSAHLLGTDNLGRDVLSRLIWGARSSLLGPLLVIVIATLVSSALALWAAWRQGPLDEVISGALDVMFAFPGILLAIGAVAIVGLGLAGPVVALGIAYTPYIGRVIRGAALRERKLGYVEALTVQGFSGPTVTLRHIVRNIRPVMLAQATLAFGWATIDLAAISFLGLGVQPPSADWGLSVAEGQPEILNHHPAQAIYPGLALILVVVAVTMLGRRLGQGQESLR